MECTSDRNVSEWNYGWKPFLYTDSYFVYLAFFSCFVMEIGGATATALYVLYLSFLSVCHLPVEGYQFTQQYRKTQHQQPSDVSDSKASHRRCNAKCHVHSMNNIKPQRLFSLISVCYGVCFRAVRVFGSSGSLRDGPKSRLKGCILRRSQNCAFFYAKEHRK